MDCAEKCSVCDKWYAGLYFRLVINHNANHNLSCSWAKIPYWFKIAGVIPLLKKLFVDPELVKNLKPISTLPFLSKTMERVAGNHSLVHKDKNHLHEKLQLAYRDHHSMETILIRIQNDVLRAIDSKQCVFFGASWHVSCIWHCRSQHTVIKAVWQIWDSR